MIDTLTTTATLATGSGLTWLGNAAVRWLRDRHTGEARIAQHRDGLTFDLLRAAREEMSALRAEVTDLRGLTAKAAHIEEALDHIHALLHAEGEAELRAAARRATAFLKRMRPDPAAPDSAASRDDAHTDIGAAPPPRDAHEEE
jgi:hypothetical protein